MLEENAKQQLNQILAENPNKIVLSNLMDRGYEYKKTVIEKKMIKGKLLYQIQRFTDKQVFHENVDIEAMTQIALSDFATVYSQMNVFGKDGQWDYKVTKKGKVLSNHHGNKDAQLKRTTNIAGGIVPEVDFDTTSHNRKKHYLIEEGTVVPPLVDLGVFTKEGKIVRTMYDKYRQINRFLELVEDVVKESPNKEMHIIDFGCGKSYLTFILYYYLVNIKGYTVDMTGLDLKADVIEKCNATAKKYGYERLHFEIGDINGYKTDKPVDMVVTLHACDTATDYALYNAIQWNANIILSVPCCQHELNAQMKTDEFAALTKYGIVKERMAALMTDSIRANALTMSGYRTQILEFVDFAASPKNLLIRAVRGQVSAKKKQEAKDENERLCQAFSFDPTLLRLLKEE